ncbi:histidine kinase [Actinoplanes sp. ATCC 53533]|uniref:sensor histidine kinase n=1 Tax=Actinoplanes sp. ATCC 53533 TaxID=1288362 RepID=UPI000F79EFBF|nr:DUF4118 domain-containing protein [Actinoplanes sp. ATCC 53533]RSM55792.1 histidine kinase [Actinoplanes sp. ATCC 53533]
MTRRRRTAPIVRWSGRTAAGVLMVAAVTGLIALLEPRVAPLHLLALYLLPVLAVAALWGAGPAALVSVLSTTVYAYLFVPPEASFAVGDRHELIGPGVFLATAVVAGSLADRLRTAALDWARLSAEQSALRRVATLVAQGPAAQAVFEAVTREVGLHCGADLARMERYEPDGTATGVAAWSRAAAGLAVGSRFPLDGPGVAHDVRASGGPIRIDTFAGSGGAVAEEARALGIRSEVGCPIVVDRRIWGVIAAATKSDRPFPADTEAKITGFTELVAIAVENADARAQLTASRARIVAAVDQTRRRIERDLHDGAQQRLVSLALQLRAAQAAVPPELAGLAAELDGVATGLTDAVTELREMARGIHPAVLTQGGLTAAVKGLARRCPIPVDLVARIDDEVPERVEVSAYYVVAEAVTNAAKHARAAGVTVAIEAAGDTLVVTVRDDGVGGAGFHDGGGLVGLRDRAEALGGHLSLDSPSGVGTTVRVEFPLRAEAGPG